MKLRSLSKLRQLRRPRLVRDWRNGWRWLSVQLMALSAAIQFGAGSLPPWLHDAVPAPWWKYLSGATLVCAIVARFIQQELGDATAGATTANATTATNPTTHP